MSAGIRMTATVSVLVATIPNLAAAAEVFVDGGLAEECLGTYDPPTRSCGSGSGTAYDSLSAGLDTLAPGDTLWIRAGEFGEQLAPGQSGSADAEITISAYQDETVSLVDVGDPALWVVDQSYLTIRGLEITESLGFGRIQDSDHITIEDNRFITALSGGTTGALKLVRTDFAFVRGNRFEDAADNMVVQESEHTLVEDNDFFRASHSLLSIRCSSFNVIRGNTFDNPDQKAAEIYDCEGVSDAPFLLDATRRNLFENNAFIHTLGSSESYRYNGIQYGGQTGIVRKNVFTDNLGGGLAFQVYPDEALNNYEHRAYNNTFVDNWCYGISSSSDEVGTYYDNLVRNNLLFGNLDCTGAPGQISIGNTTAVVVSGNAELDEDPGFIDAAALDFRLTESSAMVDAAAFVTQTTVAGRGQSLGVEDARYFYDGFGLPGELGDRIMLEGSTESARITAIDLVAHTLSLDTSLSWSAGQGVHLAYAGLAPDIGAFEHGLEEPGGSDSGEDGTGSDEGNEDGVDTTGVDSNGSDGIDDGGAVGGGTNDPNTMDGGGSTGQAQAEDDGGGGCGCETSERSNGAAAAVLLLVAGFGFRRKS